MRLARPDIVNITKAETMHDEASATNVTSNFTENVRVGFVVQDDAEDSERLGRRWPEEFDRTIWGRLCFRHNPKNLHLTMRRAPLVNQAG